MLVRHDPASAAVVRREISADLLARSVTADSVDDVVLVASELVGNAILHADADEHGLDVAWDMDGAAVTVRVNDLSDEQPRIRHPDDRSAGGRGLAIVAAIAAEWGVWPARPGKQVWARVPVVCG